MIGVLVPPELGTAIVATTKEDYTSLNSLTIVIVECRRIRHTAYLQVGIDGTSVAVAGCGEELGITGTTELGPTLGRDSEVGNPLLGDDAFQIGLEAGSVVPLHTDSTELGSIATIAGIVDESDRLVSAVDVVGGIGSDAPLAHRSLDTSLIELLGCTTHIPSTQCTFGTEEEALRAAHIRNGRA